MREFDMDSVQANRSYDNPNPGGYICQIVNVRDVPNKEYLELELDIAEGEYTGFYKELSDRAGFWGLKLYRSYKESARGMFKGFIEDIGESNSGFAWDWDENRLKGLKVGAVIGEEEYIGNDGQIKTRLKITSTKTTDQIREGKFKVPETKKLEAQNKGNAVVNNAVPAGFEEVADETPF